MTCQVFNTWYVHIHSWLSVALRMNCVLPTTRNVALLKGLQGWVSLGLSLPVTFKSRHSWTKGMLGTGMNPRLRLCRYFFCPVNQPSSFPTQGPYTCCSSVRNIPPSNLHRFSSFSSLSPQLKGYPLKSKPRLTV